MTQGIACEAGLDELSELDRRLMRHVHENPGRDWIETAAALGLGEQIVLNALVRLALMLWIDMREPAGGTELMRFYPRNV